MEVCGLRSFLVIVGACFVWLLTIRIHYVSKWQTSNLNRPLPKHARKQTSDKRTETHQRNLAQNQPHIIMIVTDDQGFNDIGYHNRGIKSPTLDHLARTGVILENYYVQPICSPTRSQLLSGRYQIHTGLQSGIIEGTTCRHIPTEMPLISDKLKQAGYKTHAIGKWHVGMCREEYLPTKRGFDTFYGFLNGYEDHYTRMHCNQFCGRDFRDNLAPVKNDNGTYSTILFANEAIEIIEKHDPTTPMFLYLAFSAVHAPLQVPKHYTDIYADEQTLNKKRKTVKGMVTCVDEAVANVTRALKQQGLWNNTVLVFTTDNGADSRKGGSNYPLRGGKGNRWEGGIRAIGFVHSPLLRDRVVGTVSRQLIHVSDWFPTLTKLAGLNENGNSLDGFNQWDVINGDAPNQRKEILINIKETFRRGPKFFNDTFDTSITAAIRQGDWKLLTGIPGGGLESVRRLQNGSTPLAPNVLLFNITADPGETTDVSAHHLELVRTLLDKLQTYQLGSVPEQIGTHDRRSNPRLHGGFWGPWL